MPQCLQGLAGLGIRILYVFPLTAVLTYPIGFQTACNPVVVTLVHYWPPLLSVEGAFASQ